MRAYVLSGYGGPESMELRDVAMPNPGPGEVLIRVHAAGLNPIDHKTRKGQVRVVRRPKLPTIAGNELSGTVEKLGAGVTRFTEGERVFTCVDEDKMGAFAEYTVVQENLVSAMPSSLDFTPAAGVSLSGLTALQALRDELAITNGTRVFISGGAGGVGTFAIQLAKWLGAHVTTTASPQGIELVRRLGADRVIDYTQENFTDLPRDFDVALDLVGGQTLNNLFKIVKPGAKVVSIAGMPEPTAARRFLHAGPLLTGLFWFASFGSRRQARKHKTVYRYMFMQPNHKDLAQLAQLIEDQKLEVVADRVFPFAQIPDALAYLEAGHAKGKVIVQVVAE